MAIVAMIVLLLSPAKSFAQAAKVEIVTDASGSRLQVDGEDFMINGMNWDYIPIGTNTIDAEFWEKSDDIIKAGLVPGIDNKEEE